MSNRQQHKEQNRNLTRETKKKMSTGAKIVSTIIVLLLLCGLAFAIFAFVDHSNKGQERLADQHKEEQQKQQQAQKQQ